MDFRQLDIYKRVNKASNFWADTVDVDYCAEMTAEEIKETDKDNKEVFFLFKKELSKCGY